MQKDFLVKNGLKVTPQRLAVLDAMFNINGHPTADTLIEFIRKNHPNIAVGTVYKTLEIFVQKGIFKRVKTEKDIMRYEMSTSCHHHLYCIESDRIEDYYDDKLNILLKEYFEEKKIPGFIIDEVKLQITGSFSKRTST